MADRPSIAWLTSHPRHLVRVFAGDEPSAPPWHALLGSPPPASPPDAAACAHRNRHAWRSDHGVAYALAPDAWLMLSATAPPPLHAGDPDVAVVDVSSAQRVVRLTGPSAATLLGTGCGVDLRPADFPVDDFAQTRLGPFAVLIHRAAEATYDVHVERSLGASLMAWLDLGAAALPAMEAHP